MRLLLFDIDGTLIESGGAGRAALAGAAAAELGLTGLAGVAFAGRSDRAIIQDVLALADVEPTPAAVDRLAAAYLARLPGTLSSHRGRILGGVVELLDALRESPAALGLATGNLRRGAELKLRHYGLWERFPAGGFGDHSPERPAIVTEAIRALAAARGVEPSPARAVVIGDTPHDVTAGRAAGARVLAVATGRHAEEDLRESGADLVLPDLTDPAAVLDFLGA
ncbi:MAG: HAD family hydrolase [Chloroflexi bacterium]|nr:HAD family hydrolase [Chloroflexota bacterium]